MRAGASRRAPATATTWSAPPGNTGGARACEHARSRALLQQAAAERVGGAQLLVVAQIDADDGPRLLRAVERDHERAVAHRRGREQGDVLHALAHAREALLELPE